MPISITPLPAPPVAHEPVEMVECKGAGHPDTITDSLAENLSRSLSRYYVDRFGFPLHHNVDKGLLWGGAAKPAFGGGQVTEPIEIYLAGRATRSYKGVEIPLEELAVESSRQWLREHIRHLDPVRHVRIHCRIRPSSRDLVDLFERGIRAGGILANDTSIGVGYFPLSPLEQSVLHVEAVLNEGSIKAAHPAIGEDIKVLGLRLGGEVSLTVACAFVDAHLREMEDYRAGKQQVLRLAERVARDDTGLPVKVEVNAADGDTEDSVYLTVTGTSAEAGDDGQVGRGNRGNGLITPYRPMSLEAVSGKNPVSHTGKLYDLAARRIARYAVTRIEGVTEAYCYLVSRIGHLITEPQVVHVQVRTVPGVGVEEVTPAVTEIVTETLASLPSLWRDLIT